jgi:uncharacterized membrane protein
MDVLRHLFSFVCGQVNCWHAATVTSAACQRCTGLYVGALIAAALFAILRPRPTSLSLWLHGLAMLAIIPFGYHLVPHGPILRAATGQLFGYGMAYYLLLVPADRFNLWCSSVPYPSRPLWARVWGRSFYTISLLVAIPLVIFTATSGSALAINSLSYLAFAGLLAVVFLIAWNIFILLATAWATVRARASAAS